MVKVQATISENILDYYDNTNVNVYCLFNYKGIIICLVKFVFREIFVFAESALDGQIFAYHS